jgi:glycosyltransferase involved in cell wall biosynthesis
MGKHARAHYFDCVELLVIVAAIINVRKMDGFSIVVPTHGRAHLVERLLQSLHLARSHFTGESEVLIFDSSTPAQSSLISAACQRWHAEYCESANDVRRKRNCGIRRARYDIVFFIDSDCEAEAETLNQHWATHQNDDSRIAAVLGLTQWTGEANVMSRVFCYAPSFSAAFSFAAWMKEAPWGTCTNLSVRRETLLAIGGFDETSPLIVYGEDVDLGLRLNKAGFTIKCNCQAIVQHNREPLSTFSAALRKAFRTGRADYHLGMRHPERLTAEFPWPIATALLLLVVEAIQVIFGKPGWMLSIPFLWLLLASFGQAVMENFIAGERLHKLFYHLVAVLLDLAFQTGLMCEALVHRQGSRLYTKFVYVNEQLVAERQKRILQMWAALLGFLAIIAFA